MKRTALSFLLITVVSTIIYSRSISSPFLFDDHEFITLNNNIKNLANIERIWEYYPARFIPNFTFALNYHLGKLDAAGFHIVNLAIHIFNGFLIYTLASLIFNNFTTKSNTRWQKLLPLIVALIFISHPLQTEAVTYITQRYTSLSAFFYLSALILFFLSLIQYQNQKKGFSPKFIIFFLTSLIPATLIMLTKENGLSLPLAMLLLSLIYILPASHHKKKTLFTIITIFIITLIPILLVLTKTYPCKETSFLPCVPPSGVKFEYNMTDITAPTYLLTQFNVIRTYIRLLILPVSQHVDYDYPLSTTLFDPPTLLSFILLMSLFTLAIYLYKKDKIISFAILFFFVTLSVESSILPLDDVFFEHRLYLPMFSFALIVARLLSLIPKPKILLLTVPYILLLSTGTILRNEVWLDEEKIWWENIKYSPRKERPYNNLAIYYLDNGRVDESMAISQKVLTMYPDSITAQAQLAMAHMFLSDVKKAKEIYENIIAKNPNDTLILYNLGLIYNDLGEEQKSIDTFHKILKIDPQFAPAYFGLAKIYNKNNQNQEAIQNLQKSLYIKDDFELAAYQMGLIYEKMGDVDMAEKMYRETLSINPDYTPAKKKLNYRE